MMLWRRTAGSGHLSSLAPRRGMDGCITLQEPEKFQNCFNKLLGPIICKVFYDFSLTRAINAESRIVGSHGS